MKKLFAIVLALMLLTSAAFAETASVTVMDNLTLLVSTADGDMAVDLSGLTITLAMGMANEVPTIQVDVDSPDENLLGAEIQFIDGRMVVNLDGMSRPIAADMSVAGGQAQEALNALFANLDEANGTKLPAFTGVNIPKIPLMEVAGLFGSEPVTDANGAQSASFSLPYEAVKGILSMLDAMIPAEAKGQVAPLMDVIHQLQATDSGFALEGKVSDDGATAELLVDLYPVEGGVTASSAAGALYFASTENSDSLEVQLYQEGQAITIGQLDLVSDPAAATLDLGIDMMGQLTVNFSLYPQDGAQVAALAVQAQGQTINASLTYGDEGETEYADFAFEIPNDQVSASIHIDETPNASGDKTGALGLNVAAQGQTINFGADLLETKGDVAFRAIGNVENAYDANNMTEADNQALGEELNNALAGLIGYLSNISVQPAA